MVKPTSMKSTLDPNLELKEAIPVDAKGAPLNQDQHKSHSQQNRFKNFKFYRFQTPKNKSTNLITRFFLNLIFFTFSLLVLLFGFIALIVISVTSFVRALFGNPFSGKNIHPR